MVEKSAKAPAPKKSRAAPTPAPEPANDRGELTLADLARGVLAGEIRPRVGEVRRLAEAVIAVEDKRAKKKAKAPAGKKNGGKKRKLAKIPGQKAKK